MLASLFYFNHLRSQAVAAFLKDYLEARMNADEVRIPFVSDSTVRHILLGGRPPSITGVDSTWFPAQDALLVSFEVDWDDPDGQVVVDTRLGAKVENNVLGKLAASVVGDWAVVPIDVSAVALSGRLQCRVEHLSSFPFGADAGRDLDLLGQLRRRDIGFALALVEQHVRLGAERGGLVLHGNAVVVELEPRPLGARETRVVAGM